MVISSVDNIKIKEISKLNLSKYRKEYNKFIVEGFHLVEEAYKANLLEEVLVLENYNIDLDVPITFVTDEVMKKITNLDTYPEVIGICKIVESNIVGNHILLLDGIQDPGNLGTIIRSAVAFNIDTIVMSYESVDLYNPKVVRATQGMLFHINILKSDLYKTILELKSNSYKIYTTNVNNGVDIKDAEKSDKYAIIMGNEGNGVREDIASLADNNIYINMNNKCESLNVGVATGIILYELSR